MKVPIKLTRMTVSNGASAAAPSLPTVRSAQPMPAHETARRRPSHGVDGRLHLRLVGHVGADEGAAELVGQRFAALLVQVGDGDSRSASGELARCRLAEA